MRVIDASILGPMLLPDDADGVRYRQILGGQRATAPEFVRVEAMSMLRRLVQRGEVSAWRAQGAIDDLSLLNIALLPVGPLVQRIWELRTSVTTYDAAYVALAEALEVPLLTADARLAHAAGVRCTVEVL